MKCTRVTTIQRNGEIVIQSKKWKDMSIVGTNIIATEVEKKK